MTEPPKQADLKFKKGAPDSTQNRQWVYVFKDHSQGDFEYWVSFHDAKVSGISYVGPSLPAPFVQGFTGNSSQEQIEARLGKAPEIIASKDGLGSFPPHSPIGRR